VAKPTPLRRGNGQFNGSVGRGAHAPQPAPIRSGWRPVDDTTSPRPHLRAVPSHIEPDSPAPDFTSLTRPADIRSAVAWLRRNSPTGQPAHPNVKDALDAAAQHRSETLRLTAASSPHTRPDTLERLYKEGNLPVREAVAGNPACPGLIHEEAGTERAMRVRYAAARNPNRYPEEALKSRSKTLSCAAAAGPGICRSEADYQRTLVIVKNRDVRRLALANPRAYPHILEATAGDILDKRHPSSADVLDLVAIIRNRALPPDAVRRIKAHGWRHPAVLTALRDRAA
jgi:hypothetical protein